MASSNQRLGWSSVSATMPGPCGSAERGAKLGGQAVAVGREVPHEHLRGRLDDLDHARPLEKIADRRLVGLEGDADEVGLHRSGSCHFAGTPFLGNAPGSTTGGCFSQVAPWAPASATQMLFDPPAGALSAPASAFARYDA